MTAKYGKELKLHLGCGVKHIDGWINIDIQKYDSVDLVADIQHLPMFENNSCKIIYSCHNLEHFGRHVYMSVLKRWHDLLKPQGTLRISVPDLEACFNHYKIHHDLNVLRGFISGGQKNEWDYHKIGFDFQSLKADLESIGFVDIRKYDWRTTEHSDMDDYSQAYKPDMDKENGMLMSLNVECTKI